MKGRKGRFLFTLFLTLLVFGFGTRIVRADETDNFQSDKKSIETAETKILEEEFDFKEIEKNNLSVTFFLFCRKLFFKLFFVDFIFIKVLYL